MASTLTLLIGIAIAALVVLAAATLQASALRQAEADRLFHARRGAVALLSIAATRVETTADRIRVSQLPSAEMIQVAVSAIEFEITTLRSFPIISLQDADAMAQFSEALGLMGLACVFIGKAGSTEAPITPEDSPDNLFSGSLEQRLRKVANQIRLREARIAELFGGYGRTAH